MRILRIILALLEYLILGAGMALAGGAWLMLQFADSARWLRWRLRTIETGEKPQRIGVARVRKPKAADVIPFNRSSMAGEIERLKMEARNR